MAHFESDYFGSYVKGLVVLVLIDAISTNQYCILWDSKNIWITVGSLHVNASFHVECPLLKFSILNLYIKWMAEKRSEVRLGDGCWKHLL